MKKGFANIQVIAKTELKEKFEDIYQQSDANSKGEFVRILLNNYINPDYSEIIKNVTDMRDEEILELNNTIEQLEIETNEIKKELSYYSTSLLPFIEQIGNNKVKIRNSESIIIDNNKDLFKLMIENFKLRK